MINELAQKYLLEHGISAEQAEILNLDSSESELHIPVLDENGETLFVKTRNLNYKAGDDESTKYKNAGGSHATLFNFHAVKEKNNIVLCEGEMDCLKLVVEDIPAISSTGGAGVFLKEWTTLLSNKRVFVCYDNDDAGRKGIKKVLDFLPDARVVLLPPEIKDVCDYFTAGNTRGSFLQLVRNAQTKSEWEVRNLPPEFSLMSAKELTEREFEQHPWYIDQILYSEGFCFIFGAEGTGKSFLAMSVAKSVATGEDWLGVFKVSKQTSVLFLDKENPHSMNQRRALGLGLTQDNVYWLEYPEKFQLSDGKGGASEFAKALTAIIKEKHIGLIIIDSFIDLMVGSENSSTDTQGFFDAIRTLYPGIAYLVLHHENKPSQGLFRSDSQRLRGSSNVSAQTFTSFRLEQVAKSKTEMTLKQTKARDAQRLDKFMLKMLVENNADKTTTVTGFTYLGVCADQEEDKSTEAEECILAILENDAFSSASRKTLIESGLASDITERTMERALKKLSENKIVSKTLKGREVWYLLNRPIVKEGFGASDEGVEDGL